MNSAYVFRSLTVTARLIAVAVFAGRGCLFAQEILDGTAAIIMEGRVVMPDGTPPPKSVGLERQCTDIQGSEPGPITDKKGHYVWSQRLSPATLRACVIRATLPGFISTTIDLGILTLADFTSAQNKRPMPDIVLTPRDDGADGNIVLIAPSQAPGKAQSAYKAAIKALDTGNFDEGIKQLQLAVMNVPKFADGWNILGSVYEHRQHYMEAKDALQHAIEVNPKLMSGYLRLARVSNQLGDWDAAAKAEDAMMKLEPRYFPEIYFQQAITRFEQKDYPGAEESAKTALMLNATNIHLKRAEYVLGRIALAKGDLAGAKADISKYMEMDPTVADLSKIQAQLDNLGNKDAPEVEIPLERP
jgi:cytochrome c-type biogenesis protein CcmH/NrfG